jgi:hypothetical protein
MKSQFSSTAVRATGSRILVDRLHRDFVLVQPLVFPQSLLGYAIAYAPGQWTSRAIYPKDG